MHNVFCSWGDRRTYMDHYANHCTSNGSGTGRDEDEDEKQGQASTRRLCEAPRHIEAAAPACAPRSFAARPVLMYIRRQLGEEMKGFCTADRRRTLVQRSSLGGRTAASFCLSACIFSTAKTRRQKRCKTPVNEARKGKNAQGEHRAVSWFRE